MTPRPCGPNSPSAASPPSLLPLRDQSQELASRRSSRARCQRSVSQAISTAAAARDAWTRRPERRQRRVLLAVADVQRRGQRVTPDEVPPRRAALLGGERLGVHGPLVAQQVADALVHPRVEPAGEMFRQPEQRERAPRVARDTQDQELALRPRICELAVRERHGLHGGALGRRQHGDRVEAERTGELVRAEDCAVEGADGIV